MRSGELALHLRQLVLQTGDPPLTLALPQGHVAMVVLPPGSGGALVRTVLGFRAPVHGSVEVLGHDPQRLSRAGQLTLRRRTGTVLDPPGLLPNLTLRANVQLAALHRPGFDAPQVTAAANGALRECGIADVADLRPGDVSPTVRTWGAIARALPGRPELLLLENLLGDLAAEDRHLLLQLCRKLGGATLFTASQPDSVVQYAADLYIELGTSRQTPALT